MKSEIKYKSVQGSLIVKDVDIKGRTVTGYASAFGNIDSDGDVVLPGAFTKTIAENGPTGSNRITFLNQHDPLQPLGKPKVLKEDSTGLYFQAPIADTTYGNNVLSLYDAGVLTEHSIGFQTVKSQDKGTRNELIELKLWEFSCVTWGSNPNTPFTGMKNMRLTKDQFAEKLDKLMKGIKAGTFSDENSYLLDLSFNELKSMYASMFDQDNEILIAVPEMDEPLDPLKNNSQAGNTLDPSAVISALTKLKERLS